METPQQREVREREEKRRREQDNFGEVGISTDGTLGIGIGNGLTIDTHGHIGIGIGSGLSIPLTGWGNDE